MTTAVVIQARMNSTRFPGKILNDIAGRPALVHVIERCHRIPGVDIVVCAMPAERDSDIIESYARGAGAETFRGSEQDVLARTLGAARSVAADVVVRVTSDCPLIDPLVCGEVVLGVTLDKADYSSNVERRSYPQGLDCEAFTISALIMADRQTTARYDREHVTPYMRRPVAGFRTNSVMWGDAFLHGLSLADKRWTLDWPEDLEFFRAVHKHGEPRSLDATLDILQRHPEIEKINEMRRSA